MSKECIQLGNNDVLEGEYVLSVFFVKTYGGMDLIHAASKMVEEFPTFGDKSPIVYKIDRKNELVFIAFPVSFFVDGVYKMISMLENSIFKMGELSACKLLDIWFPPSLIESVSNTYITFEELRKYLQVYDRPLISAVAKAQTKFDPDRYSKLCYDLWVKGCDLIVQDSISKTTVITEFIKVADCIKTALDRAKASAGMNKTFGFRLVKGSLNTISEQCQVIKERFDDATVVVTIDEVGDSELLVQTLYDYGIKLILYSENTSIIREENPFGITDLVLTKLARLSGVTASYFPIPQIETDSGSIEHEIKRFNLVQRLSTNGYFFEQTWGLIPINLNNHDYHDEKLKFSHKINALNFTKSLDLHHTLVNINQAVKQVSTGHFFVQDWRNLRKIYPVYRIDSGSRLFPLIYRSVNDADCIIELKNHDNIAEIKKVLGTLKIKVMP